MFGGPFGPYGNQFPYVNFHDLNLDWIIKCVRDNNVSVAEFAEQLTEMGIRVDEFQEYIDSLDETIQHKIDEELPAAIQHEIETGGFNQVLGLSHKRRIVFIGDSYGDGWTPDGTFPNWAVKVAGIFGLSNSDYVLASQGGAGFRVPASDPTRYVPSLINEAYEGISNPETVTDVVFGLGYNDYVSYDDQSTIKNGIVTAITTSKQKFPNARNHIFGIGFTTNKEIQKKLASVYKAYQTANADYDFHNISDSLMFLTNFSTDGIHPLESGQTNIALNIARILNGGTPFNYTTLLASNELTFEMQIGETQDVTELTYIAKNSENNLVLGTVGQFKIVNLGNTQANISGNTKIKLAKLKSCPITGIYFPYTYVWTDAIMYYRVLNDSNFYHVSCSITLALDSDNEAYLWLIVNGASGSGFVGIQNMREFGIQGLNLQLPFITKVY